jgi:hypothetical protein
MADLVTPMALRVAATLRIADHVAHGVHGASDLASLVDVDAGALDRLLRHLASVGVLRDAGPGRYALTALGRELRRLQHVLDMEGAIGRADLSFARLLHSVRTGEPAFPVHFGRPFWDDLDQDAALSASYDAQMGVDIGADAPAILAAYDWGSLGHVVDVGGGNGALLIAMLRAFPGLRGTVVDRPRTVERARDALSQAGLGDRCDAVGSSFFDPLPAGGGGYVLSAILHDWDDHAARAILARCAQAAGATGNVLVIEKIGADGESVRTAMDLRMLVYFGGRERTAGEIGALAADADLGVVAVHPAGGLAIVELARA